MSRILDQLNKLSESIKEDSIPEVTPRTKNVLFKEKAIHSFEKFKKQVELNKNKTIAGAAAVLILVTVSSFIALSSRKSEQKTVVNIDPMFQVEQTLQSMNNDGMRLYRMGNWEAALAKFEEIQKIRKNDTSLMINMALCYLKMNKNEKSEILFKKVINLEPENSIAHNNLGMLYKNQKKYSEAISQLSLAIQYSKNYEEAYLNLAHTYELNKNWNQSVEMYSRLVEISRSAAIDKKLIKKRIRKLRSISSVENLKERER